MSKIMSYILLSLRDVVVSVGSVVLLAVTLLALAYW